MNFSECSGVDSNFKSFEERIDELFIKSFPLKTKQVIILAIKTSIFRLYRKDLLSRETNNAYKKSLNQILKAAKRIISVNFNKYRTYIRKKGMS